MSLNLGLLQLASGQSVTGAPITGGGQKSAMTPSGLPQLEGGQTEEFLQVLQGMQGQTPSLANPNDPRKALRDRVDQNLLRQQKNSESLQKLLGDLGQASKQLETQVSSYKQDRLGTDAAPKVTLPVGPQTQMVGPQSSEMIARPEKSQNPLSQILGRQESGTSSVPTKEAVVREQLTPDTQQEVLARFKTSSVRNQRMNPQAINKFHSEALKLNDSLIKSPMVKESGAEMPLPEMLQVGAAKTNSEAPVMRTLLENDTSESSQGKSENQNENFLASMKLGEKTVGNTSGAKPVFNMSDIKSAENTQELINKISDYITQTSVGKDKSLDMTFGHEDLGRVKLKVSMESVGEQVQVRIVAENRDAVQFFKEHESALIQKLNQSGIQVGDFKIAQSSDSSMLKNEMSNESNRNFDSQTAQSHNNGRNAESGDRDSQRRKEIWEMYKEKMGA